MDKITHDTSHNTLVQNLHIWFADDDAFITTWVTTLSGISQLMSRFILASFLDITPFRLLVGLQTIIVLTCFLALYSVAHLGSTPYFLWMHLFFLTYPGIFAILPRESIHAERSPSFTHYTNIQIRSGQKCWPISLTYCSGCRDQAEPRLFCKFQHV